MASGWIFSCRAAGGMGTSAVKSFALPNALCTSGKFNGGDRVNQILCRGAKIKSSSIDLPVMRDFSGIRTSPKIVLKHCNAQKKDEISDSMNFIRFQQAALWSAEAAYIIWLFLLPYAPGDPVWAISPATITELIGLSLNFFFVLPIMNSAGIHVLESPVIHPMSEGLFNFVLGWTLMFAPLLFTDSRRDRFKGSLDLLWGLQMFLTNTFLIPYMAIRLNESNGVNHPKKSQPLVSALTRAAITVAITGGGMCVLSIYWALWGRPGVDFGGLTQRLEFFWSYLGSERLAYAFIWDIILYSIFQPWLIGENLENLNEESVESVKILRFFPVLGLVFYLLNLRDDKEF